MIMDGLETMLSDAVGISALLAYDNKLTKFCLLKKQMSNISTPSPATSPEPRDPMEDTTEAVLANIDKLETKSTEQQSTVSTMDSSPVELSEFFPSVSVSSLVTLVTSSSMETIPTSLATTSLVTLASPSPALTTLTASGKNGKFFHHVLKTWVLPIRIGLLHHRCVYVFVCVCAFSKTGWPRCTKLAQLYSRVYFNLADCTLLRCPILIT